MSMPGRSTPGLETPGRSTPARSLPGGGGTRRVEQSGVAIDATGTTAIGSVDEPGVEVLVVYVTATQTDFSFNVNANGGAVFQSTKSPGSTSEELFVADDVQRFVVSADPTDIVFEVTAASATGGATADVEVDSVVEDEP